MQTYIRAQFAGRVFQKIVLSFIIWVTTASAGVPAETEVVIIGAGLSGLTAAYELKKAGIPYHILELTPRVGGRVRTVRYKVPGESELYADSGMEEYWESNPAIKLLEELKLSVRSDFAASSIVLQKKLEVLGPDDDSESFLKRIFSASELRALQSFKSKVHSLLGELKESQKLSGGLPNAKLLKLKDIPFSKWVLSQKVPQRVAEWIRVSLECEIGTHWNRLSALDGISEFHIFLGRGEKSYRVIGGNEKFTETLVDKLGSEHVSLNKRVNRVVTRDGKSTVYFLDESSNEAGEIKAHHVVSTIPLFRLFEIQFDPPLSEKKRQAIASQTWGSYFKAHVFIPASASKYYTKNGASFLPILSDSELGVIYDGNPEQKTETKVLSLLVTGDQAEAFNMMPLDQVRGILKGAFEKLWPGFSKEIKGIEFYRYHPRAIAGWPVGRSRFDELSNEIRKPEHGVYLAGDFTESTHSDGALESAYRVVRDITQKSKKK